MTRNCQTPCLMISVSPSAAPPPTNTNTKYAQRLRKHQANTYAEKIKKIKILRMGRVCCWLRIRGGTSGTLWCNNTIIAEKRILRYFLATLLRLMCILSFYTINALRTQKNGRLLCVLLREFRHVPFRRAFGGRKI